MCTGSSPGTISSPISPKRPETDLYRDARRASLAVETAHSIVLDKRQLGFLLKINEHDLTQHFNDLGQHAPRHDRLNGRKSGRYWRVLRAEAERFAARLWGDQQAEDSLPSAGGEQ